MYTREQIEQHIWDYIDGLSSADDKAKVEKLLRADPEWQAIHEEIRSFHASIMETDILEQPSMRFSKNVMEEVAKYTVAPPTRSYINKKIIFGIAAFFIITIVGFIVYGLTLVDLSAPGSSAGTGFDLGRISIDWSKYLNSTVVNAFLFLDMVAGLMLLDRFLRRKKTSTQNA